jgi:hypothetical protein
VSDEGTCLEMADKDIIRTGRFGRTGRKGQPAERANVAVSSELETRECDAARRFRDRVRVVREYVGSRESGKQGSQEEEVIRIMRIYQI